MLKNLKHEAFCNEYIKHFNQVRSYMAAYPNASYDTARSKSSLLVTKDNIQQRISELLEERAERVKVTQDDVLSSILEIRDKCVQVEPVYVMVNGRKTETGEYQFKENAALKANELLGKHLGMFREININADVGNQSVEQYLKGLDTKKESE